MPKKELSRKRLGVGQEGKRSVNPFHPAEENPEALLMESVEKWRTKAGNRQACPGAEQDEE